jgi:hypothetical protein
MAEEGYRKRIVKRHCVIVQSTKREVRQNVRVTRCFSTTNVQSISGMVFLFCSGTYFGYLVAKHCMLSVGCVCYY